MTFCQLESSSKPVEPITTLSGVFADFQIFISDLDRVSNPAPVKLYSLLPTEKTSPSLRDEIVADAPSAVTVMPSPAVAEMVLSVILTEELSVVSRATAPLRSEDLFAAAPD